MTFLRGSKNIINNSNHHRYLRGGKIDNNEIKKPNHYLGRSQLANAVYTNEIPKHFTIDQEFNEEKQKVYLDKNNKPIIAFRGTVPTDINDLLNDAILLIGLEGFSPRFQNSVEFTKKVIDKYGKENISLVGHSLGSSIANYVSAETDIFGEGFNTPSTLNTFNPFSYYQNSKINNFKTSNDLISTFNPIAETWDEHNSHSI